MTPRALTQRVIAAIRDHRMWRPGDDVLVAVSGGRDSVVLLDLLERTVGLHRGRLRVATVDHGTRPDSARDADFVVALATARGLPVHRVALRLGAGASEAACRAGRYAALRDLGADVIATAHHRGDAVETLLIRLLRGTGPRGLAGLRPVHGVVVRPLLDIPEDDLAAWATRHGLAWREDPTNRDPRFLRNRVRRELLPLLESLRPGATAAIARTARLLEEESAWIDAMASRWPGSTRGDGVSTALLRDAPMPIVRRVVLARWPALEHRHVEGIVRAARAGGGEVAVSEGRRVIVSKDRAWMSHPVGATDPSSAHRPAAVTPHHSQAMASDAKPDS